MTNEEPLVIVKTCIDIVWEVIREDHGDGRGGVVREGEAPLRRGGRGSVRERAFGGKDGDVSHDRGSGICWRLEVFALRRGEKDIIGVNGDVLVKRGEKESVEDFLSYAGGSGRHF